MFKIELLPSPTLVCQSVPARGSTPCWARVERVLIRHLILY